MRRSPYEFSARSAKHGFAICKRSIFDSRRRKLSLSAPELLQQRSPTWSRSWSSSAQTLSDAPLRGSRWSFSVRFPSELHAESTHRSTQSLKLKATCQYRQTTHSFPPPLRPRRRHQNHLHQRSPAQHGMPRRQPPTPPYSLPFCPYRSLRYHSPFPLVLAMLIALLLCR
ncbi:hypothetical protein BC827DRAFT_724923 [Russula dissimulans]|nr:hypothetical protein BC827DRAFT_724923 [Russula dissimulans]